jgi:serine/threonine-protein kinase haspin
MEEAGRDLEAYRLTSFDQARSVLLQAALALAVAEEALAFEHRDLHWGNLLLRAAPSLATACRLRGMDISAQTHVRVWCLDGVLRWLFGGGGVGGYDSCIKTN